MLGVARAAVKSATQLSMDAEGAVPREEAGHWGKQAGS